MGSIESAKVATLLSKLKSAIFQSYRLAGESFLKGVFSRLFLVGRGAVLEVAKFQYHS